MNSSFLFTLFMIVLSASGISFILFPFQAAERVFSAISFM